MERFCEALAALKEAVAVARCRYCGERLRDDRGRYTAAGDVCKAHADLPALEAEEHEIVRPQPDLQRRPGYKIAS